MNLHHVYLASAVVLWLAYTAGFIYLLRQGPKILFTKADHLHDLLAIPMQWSIWLVTAEPMFWWLTWANAVWFLYRLWRGHIYRNCC